MSMFRGCDGAINTVVGSMGGQTETVIVTLGPIEVPADSVRVLLFACTQFNVAAATTGVTLNIRRGATATDTLLTANANNACTASSNMAFFAMAIDVLAGFGTVTYVATVKQTNAGANGTNQQTALFAFFI